MENLTSIETDFYPLLDKPRVYADLNGGWRDGDNYVLWLNSSATERDLRHFGRALTPGLVLDFWTDDGDDEGNLDPLLFQGEVGFDEEKQNWYAVAPWNDFHNASELKEAEDNAPTAFISDIVDTRMEYTEINLKASKSGVSPEQPIKI